MGRIFSELTSARLDLQPQSHCGPPRYIFTGMHLLILFHSQVFGKVEIKSSQVKTGLVSTNARRLTGGESSRGPQGHRTPALCPKGAQRLRSRVATSLCRAFFKTDASEWQQELPNLFEGPQKHMGYAGRCMFGHPAHGRALRAARTERRPRSVRVDPTPRQPSGRGVLCGTLRGSSPGLDSRWSHL